MGNKRAEAEFAKMCAHHNIWAHKWRDVRYCPHCQKPIFMTKRMEGPDTGKDEEQRAIIDYLIFVGSAPHWIEVKGQPILARFNFVDIQPHQRRFMDDWIDRGVGAWLYLQMGARKDPRSGGRFAWLIYWPEYLRVEEELLQSRKSINLEQALELFRKDMALEWQVGTGWVIPEGHFLVSLHPYTLTLPSLYSR